MLREFRPVWFRSFCRPSCDLNCSALVSEAVFFLRFEKMSAKMSDQQDYSSDECDGISVCRQPFRRTAVQSFDLDVEFRRRFKLYDDEDYDCAVSPECSEYSDDYLSMTGSGTSTTTLPPDLLNDRIAALSVSSGDSFCLYDPEDDDRCSISTLENADDETRNVMDVETTLPLPRSARNGAVEEELEFNFVALTSTSTVCRSASLKSTYGSTPLCSPRIKKVVRFADALGLDLESTRHILDVSEAPATAFSRSTSDVGRAARVRLTARFSEPGSSADFLRRVQERKVSLEEVSVNADQRSFSGIIRVANIAYQKQVWSHGQTKGSFTPHALLRNASGATIFRLPEYGQTFQWIFSS